MENANVRRLRFRSLRQKLNISQRQLSIDLNVSESHIRNIESGRGNPDAKLLFKLSNYLNTTPEYLFPDLADVNVKRFVKESYCHYYKRSI
ncbi:helix-turn-helix transcriptional regulator [Fictibacillus sp. 5RED26]|nr:MULTISPECIES: helix-turn-helix transcriptional regulator [unclassified Fictibacillus]MBH0157124.1 helix-turn-helix transcriptional regulator [Fictibacillus sp. 5RED26]MBH0159446.1 helix-turn-helix transcriptional regulator [Fictibacillus sp. 26RED30]MBH0163756.1 helix-turn-helix transcriptional regulator [Fictibacillus sp. 7GRE50]MBH0169619.1 helix-turn-helix transcriptional regulator [Fictibacillus sp. 18YEL24]MBH0174118.1 helix-turn-helix transcriptional regulator [Fictibacillus sp. 23RED